MAKLKTFLTKLFNFPRTLYAKLKDFLSFFLYIMREFFAFVVLIIFYFLDELIVSKLSTAKFIPAKLTSKIVGKFYKTHANVLRKLNSAIPDSISRLDLIRLAIRNMSAKRTRTLITIGGVSIGIGAIVFLVSLGYGFQRLVVSRVARLDELKQADVLTPPGSKVVINDKTLLDVKSFANIEDIYPLIAAVGRVNYQNSVSDMAVYGVTSGYLEKSAIKPVKGRIFDSNELAFVVESSTEVKGLATKRKIGEYNQSISNLTFNIEPETWLRVREAPNTTSPIIGYTKRVEWVQYGTTFFGSNYENDEYGAFAKDSNNNDLGLWVNANVYLWEKEGNDYIPIKDDNGSQKQQNGFFAYISIQEMGSVLGDSTIQEAQVLAEEDIILAQGSTEASSELDQIRIEPNSDWVDLALEEEGTKDNIERVLLSSKAKKEAVVNRAMLKLLNISEDEAVGKTFSTNFVVPTYLLQDPTKRVESETAEYTIVGVTPEDASPVFYVPFADLRSLGIVNFSQFKVSVNDTENLEMARKQIEVLGYNTSSVSDTVEQINSLFTTIRLVLGIMGMIALSVAALGMFNTLTISLLERSREIGLMKAMGMTTEEVQQLFLTESILMGFCSGFGGLFLGFLAGKLLGLGLTFLSIFKGQGFIDVSLIPGTFVLLIVLLSVLIGLLTGIYPAKRSKKISALDALRYE